jgi:hypothetical protein
MTKLFNSRYPIIESSMNQGSTVELALAVADAGAFPSLCITADTQDDDYYDKVVYTLTSFIQGNNSSNVILAISRPHLKDPRFLKIVRDYKISHIEIFPSATDGTLSDFDTTYNDPYMLAGIRFLRNTAKVITRLYEPTQSPLISNFDSVFVKGKESGLRREKDGWIEILSAFRKKRRAGRRPNLFSSLFSSHPLALCSLLKRRAHRPPGAAAAAARARSGGMACRSAGCACRSGIGAAPAPQRHGG